ncbi:MAG: hypothetical protein M0O96_03750 [Desulforhopalus sp.]|nr:hypothetical protein [Desulforhopalus sp.]
MEGSGNVLLQFSVAAVQGAAHCHQPRPRVPQPGSLTIRVQTAFININDYHRAGRVDRTTELKYQVSDFYVQQLEKMGRFPVEGESQQTAGKGGDQPGEKGENGCGEAVVLSEHYGNIE